jgi:hypothetical protein
MIGFFPVPYPDEILYSVFARYHARSRNKFLSATTKDLFGHDASRIVVDLPNKLGYLVSQLPPGSSITPDQLINDHTLLPFYAPFLPSERVKQLRQNMIERSSGGTIHGRLGILTSNIEVEYLRFCPMCAEEDIKLYGESYWHRAHQLPGIFVCPHHSLFLENSSVKCSYHGRGEALLTAKNKIQKTIPRFLEIDNKEHIAYLYLARQGYWLLQQNAFENCGPEFFRKRFLQILVRRNLATFNGLTFIKEIHELFAHFYNSELLALLSSSLENKHTWLRRLLQSSEHFQHPIRNLLFLHFLGFSLEDFLNLPEAIYPFGMPPFPCLNPVSDHFRELTINKFVVGKKQKENIISGTFTCDCGFAYRRYGWDEQKKRLYEYDYVYSYGEAFQQRLAELHKKGLTFEKIALSMNMPKSSIEAQIKILSANNFVLVKKYRSLRSNEKMAAKQKSYRTNWKEMQKTNPEFGRRQLGEVNRKIYQWLATNDKEWFEQNSPSRRVAREKAPRIDWKRKDEELFTQTEQMALEMLNSSDKPIQVTVTGIAKRLQFAYIVSKRPDCIPRTIKVLHKYAESTEEFIARRVRYATDCFVREKISAPRWKILIRACVTKPALVQLPKVQEAIAESVSRISNAHDSGWII